MGSQKISERKLRVLRTVENSFPGGQVSIFKGSEAQDNACKIPAPVQPLSVSLLILSFFGCCFFEKL